eukprot:441946-Rhodomonas_salina.3
MEPIGWPREPGYSVANGGPHPQAGGGAGGARAQLGNLPGPRDNSKGARIGGDTQGAGTGLLCPDPSLRQAIRGDPRQEGVIPGESLSLGRSRVWTYQAHQDQSYYDPDRDHEGARAKLEKPLPFKGDYSKLYNILNWLHAAKWYLRQCRVRHEDIPGYIRSYTSRTVQAWIDCRFPMDPDDSQRLA